MSGKTKIEWTDATWSPVRGCARVSRGCEHCYAERMAARGLPGLNSPTTGLPFATITPSGPRWTGPVELIESQLEVPLHWRKPRRIFVNSMSDTWHKKLHLRDIARIYARMAFASLHTYMVLTKRPENRLAAFSSGRFRELVEHRYCDLLDQHFERPEDEPDMPWPLPNVWEGVSVEDQETVDERIPLLLQTPAAVRFVSAEPLLGPVSFRWAKWAPIKPHPATNGHLDGLNGISLVIAGGESGPGARPCKPEWIRSVLAECRAAGVNCFVKQMGGWWARQENSDPDRWIQVNSKGSDPNDWPPDLQVREMPEAPCR
jgi:protein gp37